MTNYTKTSLVGEIRVVLDQNMSSTALTGLGDVDTLSLDELIGSKIVDAAECVVRNAPVELLSDACVSVTPSSITIGSDLKILVALPSDFLRLVRLKASSWPYALYSLLPESSPLYKQVHSSYGVRGTKDRPLAFLLANSGDAPVIEAYRASANADSLDAVQIVTKPSFVTQNDVTSIGLGVLLKRPTVYYAAYLVALSLQEKEAAERLLGVCNELLRGSQP